MSNNIRTTLVSSLESGNPAMVAEVLIKQNRTVKDVQQFSTLMREAVKISRTIIREEEAAHKAERLERERIEREENEANERRRELLSTGINAAKEIYAKTLISQGFSKKDAMAMTEQQFSTTFPMGKVQVKFGNTVFETSLKGKQSTQLKEALKATNLSRKQFIEMFAI